MRLVAHTLHWIRDHVVTTTLLIAYAVMSLLIVEQGRVIDSQRLLIRQLFSDSLELNAKKLQELHALNKHHSQRK